MKILLVASSSGGHVYPALALGEYLSKHKEEVTYLGINNQIEEKVIKSNLITINLPSSFKKCLKHPVVFLHREREIEDIIERNDVIIGFGGFITFFVSMNRKIKNKLFYIHDANYVIGDSNKVAGVYAKNVFTSFKDTSYFFKRKIYYSGNPVVDSLTRTKGLNNKITFIFGSLGSKSMIEKTVEYLLNQNDSNEYMLVSSLKYYEYSKKTLKEKKNVAVYSFIDKNELYSNTKILFSRAGGSTLAEILYLNIPAVVIPSPYVKHNHQMENACRLKEYNLINILQEKDYNSDNIRIAIDYLSKADYRSKLKNIQKSFYDVHPCLTIYNKIKKDFNDRL